MMMCPLAAQLMGQLHLTQGFPEGWTEPCWPIDGPGIVADRCAFSWSPAAFTHSNPSDIRFWWISGRPCAADAGIARQLLSFPRGPSPQASKRAVC